MNERSAGQTWPQIDVKSWAGTKRSFHLCLQMLGKVRLALAPAQPNWTFVALQLTARGVTTGPIPWQETALTLTLDVFDSAIVVERSTGAVQRIALLPVRTVAEIYAALQSALSDLRVACTITPVPQEVADTTPLHQDDRPAEYEPAAVQRWFAAATATAATFDAWRAHFFGRTGIYVWWGALDVALTLFNGKHATPPAERGYLMKFEDAELMNVGLYYGDETTPPFFYGYIYPQPAGVENARMAPAGAMWSAALSEWVLPYDTVRNAADPVAALRAFLDALYVQCETAAGWDRAALRYDAPKRAY